MKYKRSIISFICIICGLILIPFCMLTQKTGVDVINNYILSAKYINSTMMYLICSAIFIICGFVAMFTKIKSIRLVLHSLLVILTGLMTITQLSDIIVYPLLLIAIISLIIEIIDKEPYEKLYFVKRSPDVHFVFETDRQQAENYVDNKIKAKKSKHSSVKKTVSESETHEAILYWNSHIGITHLRL